MTDEPCIRSLVKAFGERMSDISELKFISEDPDGFIIEPVPDPGFVNQVFLVKSANGTKSTFLKHALTTPTSEIFQGEGKLSTERILTEYKSLKLAKKVAAECVPRPFGYDAESKTVAIENLEGMTTLGLHVKSGNIDIKLAGKAGEILGKLHYRTHRRNLSEEKWLELINDFKNKEIQDAFKLFVFVKPFDPNDNFNDVPHMGIDQYYEYVRHIKEESLDEKCIQVYEEMKCFCHNDLHLKSIMTDGHNLKLIDFEFSGLGSPIFDLALLVSTYIVFAWKGYATDKQKTGTSDLWKRAHEATSNIVKSYFKEIGDPLRIFGEDWPAKWALLNGSNFFKIPLFPGLETYMDNFPAEKRVKMMTIGYNLLVNHNKFKTVELVLDALFSLDD